MTFEEFVRTVADWRARLAPAHARRAIENLLQMRLVDLPRGEVLEIALLLAMVLAAKKEEAPPAEERPLVVTKSEAATPLGDPPRYKRRQWAEKHARAFLKQRLKRGPRPGAEIEAAAVAALIPESALIKAADKLGVVSRRGEWRLPGQRQDRKNLSI